MDTEIADLPPFLRCLAYVSNNSAMTCTMESGVHIAISLDLLHILENVDHFVGQ